MRVRMWERKRRPLGWVRQLGRLANCFVRGSPGALRAAFAGFAVSGPESARWKTSPPLHLPHSDSSIRRVAAITQQRPQPFERKPQPAVTPRHRSVWYHAFQLFFGGISEGMFRRGQNYHNRADRQDAISKVCSPFTIPRVSGSRQRRARLPTTPSGPHRTDLIGKDCARPEVPGPGRQKYQPLTLDAGQHGTALGQRHPGPRLRVDEREQRVLLGMLGHAG